jgi:hypothetical protein
MNLLVSDKLQEALIKSVSIKPAKRGGSIKPGVKRSEPQDHWRKRKRAHVVGDSDSNITKS